MFLNHVFEHLEALKLAFWKKFILSMYPLTTCGAAGPRGCVGLAPVDLFDYAAPPRRCPLLFCPWSHRRAAPMRLATTRLGDANTAEAVQQL